MVKILNFLIWVSAALFAVSGLARVWFDGEWFAAFEDWSLAYWIVYALLLERAVKRYEDNGCEARAPDHVDTGPGWIVRYWYGR